MVAGALARAGWSATRIAEHLDIPVAFAALLQQTAVRDGEPQPGIDAKVLGAVAETVKRTHNPAPSTAKRSRGYHSSTPAATAARRIRVCGGVVSAVALTTTVTVWSLARRPIPVQLAGMSVAICCVFVIREHARRRRLLRSRFQQPRRRQRRHRS